MHPCRLLLAAALATSIQTIATSSQAAAYSSAPLSYPDARRADQVDQYDGIPVADPYRWLEDADGSETREWVAAENKLTDRFLASVGARATLRKRLTDLWNYERTGIPAQRGGRYFFTKQSGLQDQPILYTARDLASAPTVLLDPNKMASDGPVSLAGYGPSEDGRYLAYGIAQSGSDWTEWAIRDIETGRDLDDRLRWVKFSGVSWTPDGSGFYYSRFDEPAPGASLVGTNYYQKLYFHRLGTPQSEDRLIIERPDEKEWGFGGVVTEDGRTLVISISNGTEPKNLIYLIDLESADHRVVELVSEFDAAYEILGNDGPIFYARTDKDAPQGKVIAVDIRQPAPDHWRELIAEQPETLEHASIVGDQIFARYLRDAHSQVKVFGLDGTARSVIEMPGLGSVEGFDGRRRDRETFYSFTGYTYPTTIFRYDLLSGRSELYRRCIVDFEPSSYETEQVFYPSKDGTRVPMFLTHRKGMAVDGKNPTLLTGYGGFGISNTPYFSVGYLVWMEMGGLLAVANIRGGGEYGETWHQAAVREHRQRAFDDFIAAAEWLIQSGYTTPRRLAIEGGSNGGTLVGACMTQRPDLFGAALPAAGVLDMLRYTKFTIGWAWASDFGSPDDPKELRSLLAYSPLHNVRPGTAYPATLITTADHDDRVVPAHSYKFAAALQGAQTAPAPILIRVETEAGHGEGLPMSKHIDEVADRWSFLVRVLGME